MTTSNCYCPYIPHMSRNLNQKLLTFKFSVAVSLRFSAAFRLCRVPYHQAARISPATGTVTTKYTQRYAETMTWSGPALQLNMVMLKKD